MTGSHSSDSLSPDISLLNEPIEVRDSPFQIVVGLLGAGFMTVVFLFASLEKGGTTWIMFLLFGTGTVSFLALLIRRSPVIILSRDGMRLRGSWYGSAQTIPWLNVLDIRGEIGMHMHTAIVLDIIMPGVRTVRQIHFSDALLDMPPERLIYLIKIGILSGAAEREALLQRCHSTDEKIEHKPGVMMGTEASTAARPPLDPVNVMPQNQNQTKRGGGLLLILAALATQLAPIVFLYFELTGQCSRRGGTGLDMGPCWGSFLLVAVSWPLALAVFLSSITILKDCDRTQHSELRLCAKLSIATTALHVGCGILWLLVGGVMALLDSLRH